MRGRLEPRDQAIIGMLLHRHRPRGIRRTTGHHPRRASRLTLDHPRLPWARPASICTWIPNPGPPRLRPTDTKSQPMGSGMTGPPSPCPVGVSRRMKDNADATIRPIRPQGKANLQASFKHLAPDSLYRRFLAAKAGPTARELVYLTRLTTTTTRRSSRNAPPQGDILGVARFTLSARSAPWPPPRPTRVIDDMAHGAMF